MLITHLSITTLAIGVMADSSSSSSTTAPNPTENKAQITFFEPEQTAQVPLWPAWTTDDTFDRLYESASMIDADPCKSTLAVVFTPSGIKPQTYTITDGVSGYEKTYSLSTDGFEATMSQSCSKDGSTKAVCTETWSASGTSTSTSTTQSTTFSGNNYAVQVFQVDRQWVSSGAGKCTSSPAAAAPTGLGRDVYKVVIVPAAALLAGAL